MSDSAASLGNACTTSCLVLLSLLGSKVSFPKSPAYDESVSSYWAGQAASVRPQCIVFPETAEDVSTAIKVLTALSPHHARDTTSADNLVEIQETERRGCKFAIRSGGHAAFAGAASQQDGATIDLRALNSLKVSTDKSTVSVGVGLSWSEVYAALDPLHLSVAGGRSGHVGVGGLTLGGGVSYFAPRYGWTCDTVSNYEVVLANGNIVNANEKQNPELFLALRGGWNNFGVVTRITLQAFDQGPLWGGSTFHPLTVMDANLKAFVDLNSAKAYDEYASLITSFGFSSALNLNAVSNMIEYTKPVENPPVFQPLIDLPNFMNTMRIANMTDLARETSLQQPVGQRQLYAALTVESNLRVLNSTFISLNNSIPAIADIPGIVWTMVLEPLPPAIYKRGKNSLGLEDRTKPLILALFSATWDRAEDDDRVNKNAQALIKTIGNEARKLKALDPFIYVNYAAWFQDPIPGYGKKSLDRLRAARKQYDPTGVFTHQVPGGFKIPSS